MRRNYALAACSSEGDEFSCYVADKLPRFESGCGGSNNCTSTKYSGNGKNTVGNLDIDVYALYCAADVDDDNIFEDCVFE